MIRTLTLNEWLERNPEIESCYACQNTGYITCFQCDGTGVHVCAECDGDGCDTCLGDGELECELCDGATNIVCDCGGDAKAAYHDALERETELYRQWMATNA